MMDPLCDGVPKLARPFRQTSEIDRDALLFPVAVADGFGAVAAAEFWGEVEGLGVLAAFLGFCEGAPGGGGQVVFVLLSHGL